MPSSEEEEGDSQSLPNKKQAAAEHREFIEVDLWDSTDNSEFRMKIFRFSLVKILMN